MIAEVNEHNILSILKKAEGQAEIVIIDLPGGSSALALKAFHRSHFVLVHHRFRCPT